MIFFFYLVFYVFSTEILTRLRWNVLGGTNTPSTVGSYLSHPVYPGSRVGPQYFVGKGTGFTSLYLFGGHGCTTNCSAPSKYGYMNDFWRFTIDNGTSTLWELLNFHYVDYHVGTYTLDQMDVAEIYAGIKGKYVSQFVNLPSGRTEALQWTRVDSQGYTNFYMFGGKGIPKYGDTGVLLDLWEFSTKFMGWKLLQAPQQPTGPGPFYSNLHAVTPGMKEAGTNDTTLYPGGKMSGMTWSPSFNNYMFGGTGLVGDGGYGRCADMWMFVDQSSLSGEGEAIWYFLGPDSTQYGVELAPVVEDCDNGDFSSSCHPGGIAGGMSWVWMNEGGDDLLYMFGGSRIGGMVNELWIYSTGKRQWRKEKKNGDFDIPYERRDIITFVGEDMSVYYSNTHYREDGYGIGFGGYDDRSWYRNDLWVYSGKYNQWDRLVDDMDPTLAGANFASDGYATYPFRRRSAAGWMVGDRRYVFGGEVSQDQYMGDFWIFEMDPHYMMKEFPDPLLKYYVLATVFTFLFLFCLICCYCYCCCCCIVLVLIRTLVCNETYCAIGLYNLGGKLLTAAGLELYWDEGEYEMDGESGEEEGEGGDNEVEMKSSLIEENNQRMNDNDEEQKGEEMEEEEVDDDDDDDDDEEEEEEED